MSRSRWIDVALRVEAGERADLRCPENDDDLLEVDWIPGPFSGTGEYRLHCPTCGAQNFIRVGGTPS
jgi:hypothetical protein